MISGPAPCGNMGGSSLIASSDHDLRKGPGMPRSSMRRVSSTRNETAMRSKSICGKPSRTSVSICNSISIIFQPIGDFRLDQRFFQFRVFADGGTEDVPHAYRLGGIRGMERGV